MTAISTAILIIFAVMGIIYCVREITYFLYKSKIIAQSLLLLRLKEKIKMPNLYCEVRRQD